MPVTRPVRVSGQFLSADGRPIATQPNAPIFIYPYGAGASTAPVAQTDANGRFDVILQVPVEATHVCLVGIWARPNIPDALEDAVACAPIQTHPPDYYVTSGTTPAEDPASHVGTPNQPFTIQHDLTYAQAETYAFCPPGQVNVNGQCAIGCADGFFYDTARARCVAECADHQYYEQATGQCVNACNPGQWYDAEQNVCRQGCLPGTFWDPAAQACIPGCQPNEYYDAATQACIPACAPGYWLDAETGECHAACPPGQMWTGQSCTPACQQGQVWDGRACREMCEPGEVWDGRQCLIHCAPGTFWDDTLKVCISACPPGQFRATPNGACQRACGPGEYFDGSKCVKGCAPGTYLFEGKCVPACDEDEYRAVEGGPCIKRCAVGEYRDDDGVCRPVNNTGKWIAAGAVALAVSVMTKLWG